MNNLFDFIATGKLFSREPVVPTDMKRGLFRVYSVYSGDFFDASYKMEAERPKGGFTLFGKPYRSVRELQLLPAGKGDDTYAEFRDKYGNRVLRISEDVPCFDDGDYKYDSYHTSYFIQGSMSAAVYCAGGWDGVSSLEIYYGIISVSPRYEDAVRKFGIRFEDPQKV